MSDDDLSRLRATSRLTRQTLEILANQRREQRARLFIEDGIKATDVLMAAYRLCGGDTETVCTALLQALHMTGERMQEQQRRELAASVQAIADELAAPTPEWLPKR